MHVYVFVFNHSWLLTTMAKVSPEPPHKREENRHTNEVLQSTDDAKVNSGAHSSNRGSVRHHDAEKATKASSQNPVKFQLKFSDPDLERTFKLFMLRTRHNMATFTYMLGLSLNLSGVVTVASIDASGSRSESFLTVITLCAAFNSIALILLAVAHYCRRDLSMSSTPWILFIWAVFLVQLCGIDMAFGGVPVSPGSGVMWLASMCYYTFVLYPVRKSFSLILNLITVCTHCVLVIVLPYTRSYSDAFQYGRLVSNFRDLTNLKWFHVCRMQFLVCISSTVHFATGTFQR